MDNENLENPGFSVGNLLLLNRFGRWKNKKRSVTERHETKMTTFWWIVYFQLVSKLDNVGIEAHKTRLKFNTSITHVNNTTLHKYRYIMEISIFDPRSAEGSIKSLAHGISVSRQHLPSPFRTHFQKRIWNCEIAWNEISFNNKEKKKPINFLQSQP